MTAHWCEGSPVMSAARPVITTCVPEPCRHTLPAAENPTKQAGTPSPGCAAGRGDASPFAAQGLADRPYPQLKTLKTCPHPLARVHDGPRRHPMHVARTALNAAENPWKGPAPLARVRNGPRRRLPVRRSGSQEKTLLTV